MPAQEAEIDPFDAERALVIRGSGTGIAHIAHDEGLMDRGSIVANASSDEARAPLLFDPLNRARQEGTPMDSLSTPEVSRVLARIYHEADNTDPAVFDHIIAEIDRTGGPKSAQYWAKELDRAYMPVAPDVGRFLYMLTRSRRPQVVVEFGTSFGISAIHLASALRDNGAGRLIATELNPIKAAKARENLRFAGLDDLVELREGDALQTLRHGLDAGIDMVLLDGWKEIYLPVLQLLEPHLSPGALVIADDTTVYPESVTPYLEYVRKDGNGYLSVAIPLDDGLELSYRTGAAHLRSDKAS